MKNFLIGAILGGALMYAALMYHVVRASDGLYLVPKLEGGFAEIYVDIRGFTLADWQEHHTLGIALTRAGKEHLITDSAVDASVDGAVDATVEPLRERFRNGLRSLRGED